MRNRPSRRTPPRTGGAVVGVRHHERARLFDEFIGPDAACRPGTGRELLLRSRTGDVAREKLGSGGPGQRSEGRRDWRHRRRWASGARPCGEARSGPLRSMSPGSRQAAFAYELEGRRAVRAAAIQLGPALALADPVVSAFVSLRGRAARFYAGLEDHSAPSPLIVAVVARNWEVAHRVLGRGKSPARQVDRGRSR